MTDKAPNNNGWGKWQIHVLAEMGRLADGQQTMLKQINNLPCAAHEARIKAVTKETDKQGVNWGKLSNIALAIAQALIITWVITR